MSRYTIYPYEWVDARIKENLHLIIDAIRKNVYELTAIILVGGFGRGEGSVKIHNGLVKPLNDYDLVVVSSDSTKSQVLSKLSKKLAKEIGIDFVDLGLISPDVFTSLPPTIFNYDLKYGSQVIYGNADILDRLPNYSPEDIPLWEGIRLLFNRTAGILSGFSLEHFHRDLTSAETQYMTNQVNKALTACGDALILLQKRYHYLYQRRQEIIREIFRSHRYEFLDAASFELIDNAYTEKLFPSDCNPKKPITSLLEMLPLFKKVFLKYAEQYLESKISILNECAERYLKYHSKKHILRIAKNFKDRFSLKKYTNCRLWPVLWRTTMVHGQHVTYIVLPLVLFCMPYYEKNLSLLKLAQSLLACIEVSVIPDSEVYEEQWEIVRQSSVKWWEFYCH